MTTERIEAFYRDATAADAQAEWLRISVRPNFGVEVQ